MSSLDQTTIPLSHLLGSAAFLILVLGSGAYWYRTQTEARFTALREEIAAATSTLSHNISELSEKVAAAEADRSALFDRLSVEMEKTNIYGQQVQSLASTGLLEKLSKTDKELLQKYSNVYFLSENFIPSPLGTIQPQYVLKDTKTYQIHDSVRPSLERMLQDAAAANAPVLVLSAYRSFGEQAGLKSTYRVTYGAGGANQFSADQGYSEHQLGSTVDLTTREGAENLDGFDKTPGFAWLQAHAHEYGFILSYPKGNKYFVYEPWHWRFVGRELAIKLYNEKKNFYDLDQREINQYLVKIFD